MQRWREDLTRGVLVVVGSVLLGAPAGLLWSHLAPRLAVSVQHNRLNVPDLEATKVFIGADAAYLLLVVGLGVLCGGLAWAFARRSGPWTVLALAVGGALAALVAARVGVMHGAHHALVALPHGLTATGELDRFLRTYHRLHLRTPWAAVGWPVGAVATFLIGASVKPQDVD